MTKNIKQEKTTPRIEEKKEFHMMALAKSGSAKEYGDLTVVQLGYVTQLMEEAHQAGIDKAVEFMEVARDTYNKNDAGESWGWTALDDTTKALQDKK